MVVTRARAPDQAEGRTMLWLRAPPATTPSGRHRSQHCPEHSQMRRLDPDSFSFEKDGLEWVLDVSHPDPDLYACLDCIEHRYRGDDRREASIEELVGVAIRSNWSEFWPHFAPASVADLGEFQACLFCGADPTRVTDTELTCPDHGPLRIEVERR